MDERKEYENQLKEKLDKALAAEGLKKSDSWAVFEEIATTEINRLTKLILSDKFNDDHLGYLAAKAEINAYMRMLKAVSRTAGLKAQAQGGLDALKSEES